MRRNGDYGSSSGSGSDYDQDMRRGDYEQEGGYDRGDYGRSGSRPQQGRQGRGSDPGPGGGENWGGQAHGGEHQAEGEGEESAEPHARIVHRPGPSGVQDTHG